MSPDVSVKPAGKLDDASVAVRTLPLSETTNANGDVELVISMKTESFEYSQLSL